MLLWLHNYGDPGDAEYGMFPFCMFRCLHLILYTPLWIKAVGDQSEMTHSHPINNLANNSPLYFVSLNLIRRQNAKLKNWPTASDKYIYSLYYYYIYCFYLFVSLIMSMLFQFEYMIEENWKIVLLNKKSKKPLQVCR